MNENQNEYGTERNSESGSSGSSAGEPAAAPNLTKDPVGGPPVRRLERTTNGRMIAGVCSGFGEYLGVDANILRVVLAVVTVFGGAGVLAYALAWLLIPEQGKPTSVLQDLINKQQRPQR